MEMSIVASYTDPTPLNKEAVQVHRTQLKAKAEYL